MSGAPPRAVREARRRQSGEAGCWPSWSSAAPSSPARGGSARGAFIVTTDNAYVQGDIAVLGPRIEGDVAAIHVADNQAVHAGDPLISLDATDWQARVDQARGQCCGGCGGDRDRAAPGRAEPRADCADRCDDRAGGGGVDARHAPMRGAPAALSGAGWTSRQANDQAIADRRKADAQLASAHAQRVSAEQALSVAQAQVDQSIARKQTADAAVKLAESSLSYTVIRAPFDGFVGNRAAQLGEHVVVGQQLIAVAPPAQSLFVVANFKETQLAHMQPGQKVLLTPDIDGPTISGRIASLAPATGALFSLLPPENATGNFTKVVQRVPVKIAIEPDDAARAGWLRAGLSVTASVDTRGPDAERLGLLGAAAATFHLR